MHRNQELNLLRQMFSQCIINPTYMICASIYPRPTGAVNQEPRLVRGPRQGSGGRRQARWSHSPRCGEALGAMTGNGSSSRGTRCS